MLDGFLGTRATLMLDVVFLAMFVVLPVLAVSIYLVRVRKNYLWHKRIQIALGIVLAVAVAAFEADMRLHGWTHLAEPSPYYDAQTGGTVFTVLWIHLAVAVTTAVLWVVVIVRALRNFPSPPAPAEHSRWHTRWAWAAAWGMALTAVTGWVFYYLAFVAS